MAAYHNNDPASLIEGVPVKISEKFKPPPKIVLSSSCNHSVNIALLTDEYDFKFEESCLVWINSYREQKQKLQSECDARIAAYELVKQDKIIKMKEEEEERLNKIKEEEKLKEDVRELSNCDNGEEGNDEIMDSNQAVNTAGDGDIQEKPTNSDNEYENGTYSQPSSQLDMPHCQNHLSLDTSMHQKFTQSNMQYIAGKNCAVAPIHGSGLQSAHGSLLIPTQVGPPQLNDRQDNTQKLNINIAEFETVASDPFDTAALNSINDMEELAKVLGATTIPQQATDKMANVNYNYHNQTYEMNGIPSTAPSYPYYKTSTSQAQYNTPYNPVSHNTAFSGQENVHSYGQTYPTVSQQATQYKDKYPHTQAPAAMTYTPSTNSYLGNNYMYRASDQVPAPHKRQDLEDFYSKYYSIQKPDSNGFRSGDNTPTNGLNTKLRSSASVPDLTLDDQEVSSINTNFSSSPPQSGLRSSSTGLHNYQESYCGQVNKSITPQQSRLPDPFGELNPDAQELVQNVSEMGFPRPRVARAVQKLGTDHKKLIEVLLALQDFQENGESEYTCEVAFYYYMGDLDKVKQVLPTTKQLVNLGFSEGQVVDALLNTDNDYTKALEQLVA